MIAHTDCSYWQQHHKAVLGNKVEFTRIAPISWPPLSIHDANEGIGCSSSFPILIWASPTRAEWVPFWRLGWYRVDGTLLWKTSKESSISSSASKFCDVVSRTFSSDPGFAILRRLIGGERFSSLTAGSKVTVSPSKWKPSLLIVKNGLWEICGGGEVGNKPRPPAWLFETGCLQVKATGMSKSLSSKERNYAFMIFSYYFASLGRPHNLSERRSSRSRMVNSSLRRALRRLMALPAFHPTLLNRVIF